MRIGFVSPATINHATRPRFMRNRLQKRLLRHRSSAGRQRIRLFGGGSVSKSRRRRHPEDAYASLKNAGYTIADTNEDILALDNASGKVYAVSPVLQDSGAMPYAIDAEEGDLTFANYVQTRINVLDNEDGFFIMCESGKIDWACHANDAIATITEVIDFADGIQVASISQTSIPTRR
jgi:alkaline phosphatase